MADDELVSQLRRWGTAKMTRFAANDDGPSAGDHILHRNIDLAPRTIARAKQRIVGRDGESRRRYMAMKASTETLKMSIIPVWAVDPVPCPNDAGAPTSISASRASADISVPDELRWIDRAISQLSRQHPVRAMVLREEYCGTGTQRMKAGRVERQYGGQLTVRQYRYELQRALDWMRGRLAA